jgi:phosphate-selective porin OprO/OprP
MNGGLNKLNRLLLAGAGAVGLWGIGVTSAGAQSAQELQAIQAQIQQMQATIKALEKQVQDAKGQAAAAQTAASDSKSDIDLKVKWKGAPEFSSADGKFKMKVRGRLQADYNAIDQDFDVTGRPDVSAAEIRRARLGVEGVVFYTVDYKFEVDFANDSVSIKDAYLEYTGLADGLGLRFGNFKTFNTLNDMTSSRFITMMERAAFIEAWGFDRQIGAAAIYAKEHFTLSAGIFGPTASNDEVWLQDVKTGAARITLAPINRDVNGVHQVVHLGASWRQRDGAENRRSGSSGTFGGVSNPFNDEMFRYRARGADLHLADRFISTPQIFDEDEFWGVEGAVIWGPWYAAGEYSQLQASVVRASFPAANNTTFSCCNGSDPTYTGWYVEGGWFATGETMSYKEGEFGRIKVKNPVIGGGKGGGWGAWQIVGRYDVVDLTDKALTLQNPSNVSSGGTGTGSNYLQSLSTSCTQCGEQKTWGIGINWWLNDYTRFQFNYNESDISGGPLLFTNANGAVVSANQNDGANIKGFGMRAQVDW